MNSDDIIFAGPLIHDENVGGVVLLFEDLVFEYKDSVKVIDTNAKNYRNSLFMVLKFVSQCIPAVFLKRQIALHGTAKDYKYLGLILLLFHYIFGLKYHTRKFGGNYDEIFLHYSPFWKFVTSRFLSNSSVNYFETLNLVEFFSIFNDRTCWFPNYRTENDYKTSNGFHGRLIFIAHVKKEKGIDEILALDKKLPDGWIIDIYGPIEGYDEEALTKSNISYKGVVSPSKVTECISNYDILLLPTFHEGEGYPGVVLEAYSVGVPVVVTRWRALPEIVDDSCGALIEPGNAESLLQGILHVSNEYESMSSGATKKFELFNRKLVLKKYISVVSAL